MSPLFFAPHLPDKPMVKRRGKLFAKRVYMIPCDAVPKMTSLGRFIHNYSFLSAKVDSVNLDLKNTSVKYISCVKRVELARVDW